MSRRSIKIVVDDENISNTTQFYAGPQVRLATATDVVFLPHRRLLVSHLAGQTLHLVQRRRFSDEYRVLDTVITEAAGQPTINDLLSYNGKGVVAVSNCRVPSVSLYRVGRSTLTFLREIEIPEKKPGFTHGVEFTPDGRHVCIVNSGGTCRVRIHEVGSGDEVFTFELAGWRPKDATYLDDNHLILPLCDGSPTSEAGEQYNSRIAVVRVDLDRPGFQVVAYADLPGAHVDGVFYFDGHVAVADQTNDLVRFYKVDRRSIEQVSTVSGIDFPHGVCFDRHKVGVTSYGDSSLNIFPRGTTHFVPDITTTLRRDPAASAHLDAQRVAFSSMLEMADT
ncbi:MAG: hypothetical protein R2707_03125 [Acidimicrobiales bacterium]